MRVAVLTVDQRGSSKQAATDRVPGALAGLAGLGSVGLLRAFERTAGDEFQGVLDDPRALAPMLERLLRDDTWNIGVGIGQVDEPLPESTRAGRGAAYVHARDAVTGAKSSPWHLRVVGDLPATRRLETSLWLWAAVLARRTRRGWQVATSSTAVSATTRQPSSSPSASPRSASARRPPGSWRAGGPANGHRAYGGPPLRGRGRMNAESATQLVIVLLCACLVASIGGWARFGRTVWPPFAVLLLAAAGVVAAVSEELDTGDRDVATLVVVLAARLPCSAAAR